jgi:hypothetical protein
MKKKDNNKPEPYSKYRLVSAALGIKNSLEAYGGFLLGTYYLDRLLYNYVNYIN